MDIEKQTKDVMLNAITKYAKEYENVNKLCYITATPHSLIVRYNRMNVLKVNQVYNRKTYNKNVLENIFYIFSFIKKIFYLW